MSGVEAEVEVVVEVGFDPFTGFVVMLRTARRGNV